MNAALRLGYKLVIGLIFGWYCGWLTILLAQNIPNILKLK